MTAKYIKEEEIVLNAIPLAASYLPFAVVGNIVNCHQPRLLTGSSQWLFEFCPIEKVSYPYSSGIFVPNT